MVQFDNQYRQVKIKVVYYGPALGGKTTCLQHIHRVTDPQQRTRLYSLNTAQDRTLFFDLLALELGRIRGFRLALQLYTVPGQVQYNATRRAVLSGADAIVFVADSQAGQREANVESLANLWENLAANGLEGEHLPLVFQYNKRDLPDVLPVADMEAELNVTGAPAFPTVAITGEGVMEAFAAVAEAALVSVADKLGVGTGSLALQRLREQTRTALQPFVEARISTDREATPPEENATILRPELSPAGGETLGEDALVEEAVRANVLMTDLNVRLETLQKQLERKVRILRGVSDFVRAAGEERDPQRVFEQLLDDVVGLLEVQAAAVLLVPGSGQLKEALVRGVERDPWLAATDGAGEPLALGLLEDRQPRLVTVGSGDGDPEPVEEVLERAGYRSGLAVPLLAQGRLAGMLTAYAEASRPELEEEDLQLATVLASTAAVVYANAVAWKRLSEANRDLEDQVARRTRELEDTLDEVQKLAAELTQKNALLENAYAALASTDSLKRDLIGRISAELKEPVSSLVTASRILAGSEEIVSPKTRRLVEVVREEADRLGEMMEGVAQAGVLVGATPDFEVAEVTLPELMKNVVAPLRELADGRHVVVHVRAPSDLGGIRCDAASMFVALRAVLKNAIEFSGEGEEVELQLQRIVHEGVPWVVVRVLDAGPGVPEEDLPHVFEPFWKGRNASVATGRGLGLGLTIARSVVERHRGRVVLKNRQSGGTAVELAWPE